MSEIEIYKSPENNIELQENFDNETVWLNQYQLAELLFSTDRTSIVKHLQNIYAINELDESATCAKFAQVRKEINREVKRNLLYFYKYIIIPVSFKSITIKRIRFPQSGMQFFNDYFFKFKITV